MNKYKAVHLLSSEEKMDIIYDYFINHSDAVKEQALAIYDLACYRPIECNLLAWMYKNKNKELKPEAFCSLSGLELTDCEDLLCRMEKDGAIYLIDDDNYEIRDNIDLLSGITNPVCSDNYPILHGDTNLPKENTELTDDEYMSKLCCLISETIGDDYYSLSLSDIQGKICSIESMVEKRPDFQFSKGYSELKDGLSDEEKAVLLVLASYFALNGIEPFENYDSQDRAFLKGRNGLIDKGLAVIANEESNSDNRGQNSRNRLRISSTTCRALFYGLGGYINFAALSHQGELIKYDNIFEKELFFEQEDNYIINNLKALFDKDQFENIKLRLKSKGRHAVITCLFYGSPGVGKTELCKQLARSSCRDILLVDASKIYGTLWGESEKNTRELFDNFKYLVSVSKEAPILLFNEADGILGKRIPGDTAIAKAENTVQNIILQCLEDFDGIFIATTNLEGSLDKAFERRFLFKVAFKTPSVSTRAKIWHYMLPDLTPEEAQALATEFNLSGGQIENVATKRCLHEVIHGKTPSLELMREFCTKETIESMHESTIKEIQGFSSYNHKNSI